MGLSMKRENPYRHPRRMFVRSLTGGSTSTGSCGIRDGRNASAGSATMTSGETAF